MYKVGQRVKVIIEGEIAGCMMYDGDSGRLSIGDNTVYYNDGDHPDVKTTVEVIAPPRPTLTEGQVWRTVNGIDQPQRWLVRMGATSGLKVLSQRDRTAIPAGQFFDYYPNAELLLDVED